MTETHPGHWNDQFNDTFIDAKENHFVVSQRQAGNRNVIISRHHTLAYAFRAAAKISYC